MKSSLRLSPWSVSVTLMLVWLSVGLLVVMRQVNELRSQFEVERGFLRDYSIKTIEANHPAEQRQFSIESTTPSLTAMNFPGCSQVCRYLITPTIGPPGINGTDGARGPPGLNGTDGVNGTRGPQGIQGIQGVQGIPSTSAYIQALCLTNVSPPPLGNASMISFGVFTAATIAMPMTTRISVPITGVFQVSVVARLGRNSTTPIAITYYLWLRVNGLDLANSGESVTVEAANVEQRTDLTLHRQVRAGGCFVEVLWSASDPSARLEFTPASITNSTVYPGRPIMPARPAVTITMLWIGF